jgi:hypothetical protein
MSIIIAPTYTPKLPARSTENRGGNVAASEVPGDPETSLDVIVKLIPAEVVTLYAAASAFPDLATSRYGAPALLVLGTLLTPLVLFLVGRRLDRPVSVAQYVVRILAFVAWAFTIGNPLAPHDPVPRWIPGIAVLVIPIVGSLLFPAAVARPARR